MLYRKSTKMETTGGKIHAGFTFINSAAIVGLAVFAYKQQAAITTLRSDVDKMSAALMALATALDATKTECGRTKEIIEAIKKMNGEITNISNSLDSTVSMSELINVIQDVNAFIPALKAKGIEVPSVRVPFQYPVPHGGYYSAPPPQPHYGGSHYYPPQSGYPPSHHQPPPNYYPPSSNYPNNRPPPSNYPEYHPPPNYNPNAPYVPPHPPNEEQVPSEENIRDSIARVTSDRNLNRDRR